MNILKSGYLAFLTWRKFGTTKPREVVPPGSPSPVHINPEDRRALKKLAHDTVRGRTSVPMRFWRAAVSELKPQLAVDVGANYGECFSSMKYEEGTRVVAVEANVGLIPFLAKTREAHPSKNAIRVVNCLISERPAAEQVFYFKPDWTGGGSAVVPANPEDYQKISVPVDSMDHLLAEDPPADTIVFKADIEGYEGMLFRGFGRLFSATRVAGIFEFDTRLMARAGTPPREVFEKLASRFELYDTLRKHQVLKRVRDWDALVAARSVGGADFHTDLVAVTSMREVPPGWTVFH
jgi:FkbM family methyltransferase